MQPLCEDLLFNDHWCLATQEEDSAFAETFCDVCTRVTLSCVMKKFERICQMAQVSVQQLLAASRKLWIGECCASVKNHFVASLRMTNYRSMVRVARKVRDIY